MCVYTQTYCQAWCYMPLVMPTLRRQREEDVFDFQASQSYLQTLSQSVYALLKYIQNYIYVMTLELKPRAIQVFNH